MGGRHRGAFSVAVGSAPGQQPVAKARQAWVEAVDPFPGLYAVMAAGLVLSSDRRGSEHSSGEVNARARLPNWYPYPRNCTW